MRSAHWLSGVALLAACGIAAVWLLLPGEADRLRKEKEAQALEIYGLQQAVSRLTGDQRVAEVHVVNGLPASADEGIEAPGPARSGTDTSRVLSPKARDRASLTTTIEFIELDRQQHPLPGKRFVVQGDVVFFDALVIQFDQERVAAGDALRGKSLALFRRVYGEYQNPAEGFAIDPAGDVPNVFRIEPQPSPFERKLWERFWHYAGHPDEAAAEGVRVVQGEAVYVPMRQGQVWSLSLQNNGGLNIRLHRWAATEPAAVTDRE